VSTKTNTISIRKKLRFPKKVQKNFLHFSCPNRKSWIPIRKFFREFQTCCDSEQIDMWSDLLWNEFSKKGQIFREWLQKSNPQEIMNFVIFVFYTENKMKFLILLREKKDEKILFEQYFSLSFWIPCFIFPGVVEMKFW
jgi:hypothetical protein